MVYMLIIGAIFAAANIYASHIMFWTKIDKIKKKHDESYQANNNRDELVYTAT